MKPGARLLNLARGEVVDLDALQAALEAGRLAGPAIDAYVTEPPDISHPIFHNPKVVFMPHSGGDTLEAIETDRPDEHRRYGGAARWPPAAADAQSRGLRHGGGAVSAPRYDAAALTAFAGELFLAAGLEQEKAAAVATYLVEADLMGHSTHGLALAGWYLQSIADGVMTRAGAPDVVSDRGAAVCWRGRRLPGAWLTSEAVKLACARARAARHCDGRDRRQPPYRRACGLPHARDRRGADGVDRLLLAVGSAGRAVRRAGRALHAGSRGARHPDRRRSDPDRHLGLDHHGEHGAADDPRGAELRARLADGPRRPALARATRGARGRHAAADRRARPRAEGLRHGAPCRGADPGARRLRPGRRAEGDERGGYRAGLRP